ncbi:MAG: hypothetical protein IKA32_00940 [Lentisphaeria bacterium]|nr:hypothetical protein [Lentisphaeria bacterium]
MKIKASGQYFQRLEQVNKYLTVIAFATAFAGLNIGSGADSNYWSHHNSFSCRGVKTLFCEMKLPQGFFPDRINIA